MALRIDGKAVAAKVKARAAEETAALKERGIVPGLAGGRQIVPVYA